MENKLDILLEKLDTNTKIYKYYDDHLGIELEIKKFSLRKYNKMQEGSDKNTDKALTVMYNIIYEHVPLFQSPEIYEKLGVEKKESVIPAIYGENLKPIEKLMNYINNEVYQLGTDIEKK